MKIPLGEIRRVEIAPLRREDLEGIGKRVETLVARLGDCGWAERERTHPGTFSIAFTDGSAVTGRWEAADKLARRMGGHLTAIEDQEENEVISWIGLPDAAEEGKFKWVTGEPLRFERWNIGEPNAMGDEDSVFLYVRHNDPRVVGT